MQRTNGGGTPRQELDVASCFKFSRPRRLAAGVLVFALVLLSACTTSPEAREAKYLARGKGYLAARKYKEAVIEFKVASQNMPKDAEPVYQLGMTYLGAGSTKQALGAFQKAQTLNPNHEGVQYQIALFETTSNKPEMVEEARKILRKYVEAHTQDAESAGALALAEAKLGNNDGAVRMLHLAAGRDASKLQSVSRVIGFYLAKGDTDTAKQIAREISEQLPNSAEAATIHAQVSLALRDHEGADALIDKALQLQRNYSPALALRLRRELMTSNRQNAEQTSRELAKLPERRTWSAYARMLFAEQKFDEAAAEFERVLKERGDPADIRDEYAGMLMAAGRRKQAEALITATLAKNPKDSIGYLQRATIRIDNGDIAGATNDIKAVLELKALSPALSYQQSRLAALKGDIVKQGDLLTDALRGNPRLLSARLDLARLLAGTGRCQNALPILEGASAVEKATEPFIFHRNMALIACGEFEQARKGVDAGLAAVRSASFLYQDGLLRARNNDLSGARKSLEASFQMEPSNTLTLALLGDVIRKQGMPQEFVKLVREAAARNPASVQLHLALGDQLAALGDSQGARQAYSAARAVGAVVVADVAISRLDMQAGSVDAARQRLTELIKTRDSADARLILAEIETRKGAANIAVQHYLKALELQPGNVSAMNNLAVLTASNPATNADALFWARKAMALAPASPTVADTLGWVYYLQGKYSDALPFLRQSLQAQDRPLAHYHLAAALIKGGDSAGGQSEYALAVKQDPQAAIRASLSPLFGGK